MYQEKLRNWLKNQFGTLTEAAEKLEMSLPNLSRYLREGEGGQKPGFEFLEKLRGFGCDINWLLSNAEQIIKEPSTDYKVRRLEEDLSNLKEENEALKKIITSGANYINRKKLKRGMRK